MAMDFSRRFRRPVCLDTLSFMWTPGVSQACGVCADTVDALIYGQDFALNLLRMLAPVALIAAIAFVIHHTGGRKHGD